MPCTLETFKKNKCKCNERVFDSGSHSVVTTTTTALNGVTRKTTSSSVNRTAAQGQPTNEISSTTGFATYQTDSSWSSTVTARTVTHSRAPVTTVTGITMTTASNVAAAGGDGDGDNETTNGVPSDRITSTSAQPTPVHTGGHRETDAKSDNDGGGGGGYIYGGGNNRHGGGYDERDGETMMTTPAFGGESFVPAVKPTPPKITDPPINTKAAESTAFVVLVTAATLIIIVLIILLVLKVKYRTDTNRYKIEIPKVYGGVPTESGLCQQQQNANLLSPGNYPSSRQSSPTYAHQNNFRPHGAAMNMANSKPKKRQDVKEWYV